MKRITIGWTMALLITTLSAGAREFKDATGRKIEAEISAVRGSNVALVKDGKTFLFPLAKLSEEDKEFVRQWMAENPDVKLEYRFEKEKVSSAGDSKRRLEKWAYKVTVSNRGLTDLEGLTIDYKIFKQLNDRTTRAKKSISGTAEGTAEISGVEAQRQHVFKTKPIDTQKVNIVTKVPTDVAGVYDSTFEKWSETLMGITITVKIGDKVVDQKTYGVVK